ncbi:hypothetical protein [Kinneretia aquatilis]|uniref:hypothetical protein n=1 Tax=Kinneretia aquatilis TaxID=2070761 RepID=UPI0010572D35|nr:hypothetical protein [Paucibacter aquatile]
MRIDRRLLCAAALFAAASCGAQTSKEYAVMGRSAWSAFECSSLASQMKDPQEQERLFNAGYKDGLAFITALQAQKIDRKDVSSEVPIGVRFLLQGPTPDFMLGRMYESAQDEALKDVTKTGQQLNSDDLQKTLAQSKYTKKNCRLVGGRQ